MKFLALCHTYFFEPDFEKEHKSKIKQVDNEPLSSTVAVAVTQPYWNTCSSLQTVPYTLTYPQPIRRYTSKSENLTINMIHAVFTHVDHWDPYLNKRNYKEPEQSPTT